MTTAEIHGTYEHWSMVVVYDAQSGQIAHTHQVVTTRGGAHPDAKTMELLAAEHGARARNKPLAAHAFLHVDPKGFDFDASYTVDSKSQSLRKVTHAG